MEGPWPRPRIGASACVLGEPVRFNGGHCRDRDILPQLAPFVEFVAVCPEVEAGLGAPRESLRLVGSPGAPRLVGGRSGIDRTPRLEAWSKARVRALAALALDGFVLKKGSPSCGMERVRVYRRADAAPSFDGVGVFARELVARLPSLAVEEEGRLHDPGLREQWVTRVFGSAQWRAFAASAPSAAALAEWHEAYSLLLVAHDPAGEHALRGIAATRVADEDVLRSYGDRFLRALGARPTRASQAGVMLRLLAPLRGLSDVERRDVRRAIHEYVDGFLPLAVPARVLLHHLRGAGHPAAEQVWFAPWPEGIRLRTQVTK